VQSDSFDAYCKLRREQVTVIADAFADTTRSREWKMVDFILLAMNAVALLPLLVTDQASLQQCVRSRGNEHV
jgi:hypothetical protein